MLSGPILADYSRVTDYETMPQFKKDSKKQQNMENFTSKLHFVLERAEEDRYASIIAWLPHGRVNIICISFHDVAQK